MITQIELKKLLHYNHKDGSFTWKKRPRKQFKSQRAYKAFNSRFNGKPAGCKAEHGSGLEYIHIRINNTLYLAHRLAWLYVNGEFPLNEIDHIDGDGLNNSIKNLRDVTHQENNKNRRVGSSNTSGVMGVNWNKNAKSWHVRVGVNGESLHIGYFKCKKEAESAKLKAEIEHGYHENHGRPL